MHNKLLTTDLFLFRASGEKISANELEEEEGLRECLQGEKPIEEKTRRSQSVSQGWRQPSLSEERGWEPEDPAGQQVHGKDLTEQSLHGCFPHSFELVKFQWMLPALDPWRQNGKGNLMGLLGEWELGMLSRENTRGRS